MNRDEIERLEQRWRDACNLLATDEERALAFRDIAYQTPDVLKALKRLAAIEEELDYLWTSNDEAATARKAVGPFPELATSWEHRAIARATEKVQQAIDNLVALREKLRGAT
jgi:hypothetical protein